MLTAHKKALILTHAGIHVPPCPDSPVKHASESSHHAQLDILKKRKCSADHAQDVRRWNYDVSILYAEYTAARAAKTLRDAEAVRQMAMLRLANARP
jgi:hypothetical protein